MASAAARNWAPILERDRGTKSKQSRYTQPNTKLARALYTELQACNTPQDQCSADLATARPIADHHQTALLKPLLSLISASYQTLVDTSTMCDAEEVAVCSKQYGAQLYWMGVARGHGSLVLSPFHHVGGCHIAQNACSESAYHWLHAIENPSNTPPMQRASRTVRMRGLITPYYERSYWQDQRYHRWNHFLAAITQWLFPKEYRAKQEEIQKQRLPYWQAATNLNLRATEHAPHVSLIISDQQRLESDGKDFTMLDNIRRLVEVMQTDDDSAKTRPAVREFSWSPLFALFDDASRFLLRIDLREEYGIGFAQLSDLLDRWVCYRLILDDRFELVDLPPNVAAMAQWAQQAQICYLNYWCDRLPLVPDYGTTLTTVQIDTRAHTLTVDQVGSSHVVLMRFDRKMMLLVLIELAIRHVETQPPCDTWHAVRQDRLRRSQIRLLTYWRDVLRQLYTNESVRVLTEPQAWVLPKAQHFPRPRTVKETASWSSRVQVAPQSAWNIRTRHTNFFPTDRHRDDVLCLMVGFDAHGPYDTAPVQFTSALSVSRAWGHVWTWDRYARDHIMTEAQRHQADQVYAGDLVLVGSHGFFAWSGERAATEQLLGLTVLWVQILVNVLADNVQMDTALQWVLAKSLADAEVVLDLKEAHENKTSGWPQPLGGLLPENGHAGSALQSTAATSHADAADALDETEVHDDRPSGALLPVPELPASQDAVYANSRTALVKLHMARDPRFFDAVSIFTSEMKLQNRNRILGKRRSKFHDSAALLLTIVPPDA